MSITLDTPVTTTEIVSPSKRGYSSGEAAATAAAKLWGVKVRGSRYYDAKGALVFINREEAVKLLRGYGWLVLSGSKWLVQMPAREVGLLATQGLGD